MHWEDRDNIFRSLENMSIDPSIIYEKENTCFFNQVFLYKKYYSEFEEGERGGLDPQYRIIRRNRYIKESSYYPNRSSYKGSFTKDTQEKTLPIID